MSIVAQIQQLNDIAKIGGSQGIARIYLSSDEIGAVYDEMPYRWLSPFLMVDGVWIYWNGR